MNQKPKLLKSNYILVNKNQFNIRPKTTKERLQDMINQNEETIKKYEKLKEKSLNPAKKAEYVKTISKYRSQQIKLHNKLYSLNLFLNICMNNTKRKIPKPKPKFDISNNIYLKQYFHNKVNSALKPNFNYSNILTNSNNSTIKKNLNKKDNKYNPSIISIIDNKKNFINPIKKINLINNKKKEININNNYNANNNAFKMILNTSTQTRSSVNNYSNKGHNSTLITCSSTKLDIKGRNKYIIQPINENNHLYHSKKNIFIINNINNYYNNNFSAKKKSDNVNSIKIIQNKNDHIVNKNIRKKIKDKILKFNIIDEDEQLDINYDNEDKNINCKQNIFNEDIEFKANPNLILRKKYFKIKHNTIIELYYSYHDNNELYMATSEKSILGYNIKIIKFKKKIFVTRLKKHNNKIIVIKHFFNKKKMHDYLISGDLDNMLNIWDISYKYFVNQFVYKIKYNGNDLYNLFCFCIEEKDKIDNYILIYDKTINIYRLSEGNFIKNINHFPSKEEKILNLINWKNKDNNLDYIIKCTLHKIIIFNFIDEDIFFELSNYLKNIDNNNNQKTLSYKTEGCIISNNKNDYLCILSSSMNLEIWDLYNLNLKEKISINANINEDINLFEIIRWNNRYLLLIDGDNNYIYVIDVLYNKIYSKLIGCFRNNIRKIYYKKIINKIYGESLLIWCSNRHISLLSSNDFSFEIFDENNN